MPILEVTQEAFNFKDSGGEPAQVFLSSPVFKSLHWAGCPFSSSPSPVQDLGGLKGFQDYEQHGVRRQVPERYSSTVPTTTCGGWLWLVGLLVCTFQPDSGSFGGGSTRFWWFLEQVQKGPRFRLIGQPKRWRTIQKDTNDNLLVKSSHSHSILEYTTMYH